LSEDDRCRLIAEAVNLGITGVFIEKNQPEKIARYIRKVLEVNSDARHIDTTPGPVPALVLVRFGPKAVH
jgi:hypothetical protein